MSADSPLKNFESKLESLEQLVDKLESGDLDLETAMKEFERGVSMTRECQNALNSAEQRVKTLVESASGEPSTEDMVTDSERANNNEYSND